jgi:hypothetical protein
MRKLIQICPCDREVESPHGLCVLYGLTEDGNVWRLYTSSRGDVWVPVRAATYSTVGAVRKQDLSGVGHVRETC